MAEFKPGDKLRVSFEVVHEEGRSLTPVNRLIENLMIDVLEPADDPSKDPVGTVRRQSSTGRVVIKADPGRFDYPWKALDVRNSGGNLAGWSDDSVVGWEKLAPVEGTPASVDAGAEDSSHARVSDTPAAKVGHAFVPSFSGMVCARMVIRDGYGDSCGLPADVHGGS